MLLKWHRLISFVRSQFRQVMAGGLPLFWRKAQKAAWMACLELAAPVAIYFNIDWPAAYEFLAHRAVKKAGQLRLQPQASRTQINQLVDQAILYLEKSIGQGIPDLSGFKDWMEKRIWLGDLYWSRNKAIQSIHIHQKTAEIRRQILEKHQFADLEMEFIPRRLPQGAIGVFEYFEAYVKTGMMCLRPNKEMIIVLEPNVPLTNPCYFKYWSRYLKIISDPQTARLLEPLEDVLTTPMLTFIPIQDKFCHSVFALGIVRQRWLKENKEPLLVLTNEDRKQGWDVLKSWGIPQDAWFVALHVREAGWKDRGSREEQFRNGDIDTYFPAIKAITDAGGWVVRIGDPSMAKLAEMPQVIDYAHSKDKSDWMDIFLCSQCRFMVGSSSGMYVVALNFGVPLVLPNVLPGVVFYYLTSKDLFIPRLCFSKDKGRFLDFSELMSPPAATAYLQSHFDDLGLEVIANTAEEIRDLVEEMLDKVRGQSQYNEEDDALQEKLKRTATECGKVYADKEFELSVYARMGRNFLRKHVSLLPCAGTPPHVTV